MKDFKDILREYQRLYEQNGTYQDSYSDDGNGENNHWNGFFGGSNRNNGIPRDSYYEEIRDFMTKTNFNHSFNTSMDEMGFASSHDAAKELAHQSAHLEHGYVDLGHTTPNAEAISNYLKNAIDNHEHAYDQLETHIKNHPRLPKHLKPHVSNYFEDYHEYASSSINTLHQTLRGHRLDPANIIKRENFMNVNSDGEHPHLNDEAFHFKRTIASLRDGDIDGFYLPANEVEGRH